MKYTKEQMNEHFNPEMGNNGGGYDQPRFTVNTPYGTLVIEDYDMGDFGEDIYILLNGKTVCGYKTGDPDNSGIWPEKEEMVEQLLNWLKDIRDDDAMLFVSYFNCCCE